jgi:hypothetical protein
MLLTNEFLNDFFKCTLCLNIMISPYSSTCGHNFCKNCIYQAQLFCRNCNRFMKENEIVPNNDIRYAIKVMNTNKLKENRFKFDFNFPVEVVENKNDHISLNNNTNINITPKKENDPSIQSKYRCKRLHSSLHSSEGKKTSKMKTNPCMSHNESLIEMQLDIFLEEFQSLDYGEVNVVKNKNNNVKEDEEFLDCNFAKRFKR